MTYLTVWQVELITPDRIYPKWLKLPHLESQGGQRGGRNSDKIRKKIRFIMENDVCNGRGYLFPKHGKWENIEYEEKLGLFLIPIFVTDSYPLKSHRGDI